MRRKELEKLDHSTILYQQFLLTCISYKQVPYHVVIFDTDKKRQTLDIYKKTSNGFCSTKKLTIPREDVPMIQQYLIDDYPEVEFKTLDLIGDAEE